MTNTLFFHQTHDNALKRMSSPPSSSSLVSQFRESAKNLPSLIFNKVQTRTFRYQENGFDLDLSCKNFVATDFCNIPDITDRIIVLSSPVSSKEKNQKNSVEQVSKFE